MSDKLLVHTLLIIKFQFLQLIKKNSYRIPVEKLARGFIVIFQLPTVSFRDLDLRYQDDYF
jgi:hypothetical protein